MSSYFDWPGSSTRFVRFSTALAEEVNAAFDLVSAGIDGIEADIGSGAPIDSPAFTGTPTAPTPTAGDNSTKLATTEYVDQASFSSSLPAQSAYSGMFLRTDGTNAGWQHMLDGVVNGGIGWSLLVSGGTAEEPGTLLYSRGTERVRQTLTWVGGNVTESAYSYSANSGVDYTGLGNQTISYDGSGNVTATSW